jgi:hypothetical protein
MGSEKLIGSGRRAAPGDLMHELDDLTLSDLVHAALAPVWDHLTAQQPRDFAGGSGLGHTLRDKEQGQPLSQ